MNVNTVKMRFIDSLCPPALLYILFVAIQVALDISLGMFITAGLKVGGGVLGAIFLNALCGVELGVVAWAIIATPFIITSLATAISMGLDIDHRVATTVREHLVNPTEGSLA